MQFDVHKSGTFNGIRSPPLLCPLPVSSALICTSQLMMVVLCVVSQRMVAVTSMFLSAAMFMLFIRASLTNLKP